MSQKVLDRIEAQFPGAITARAERFGDDVAVIGGDRLVDILTFLKNDAEMLFDLPADLTAVDFLGREPRFEVVYNLYSTQKKHRVRLKVLVPEDKAEVPTSVFVYPGWNWFEREVWDMYGIKFVGNPDQRRLFMYESFVGHPLRKDYPKEQRQPLARREGITR
jgi:NADH-quinone oxidoreductase subunit C